MSMAERMSHFQQKTMKMYEKVKEDRRGKKGRRGEKKKNRRRGEGHVDG